MKRLSVKTYEIQAFRPDLQPGNLKLAFLTDYHNLKDIACREKMLDSLAEYAPDLVLVGGDMLVAKRGCSYAPALFLMRRLASRYRVYYAFGNHEYRMVFRPEHYGTAGICYEERLRELGVHLLRNETAHLCVRNIPLAVTGLEIPFRNYKKWRKTAYSSQYMEAAIGKADKQSYQILLAHNPVYADEYFAWNPDLIFSGHMHGGVMRLFGRPVIGTDGKLFPRYGYGRLDRDGKTMLVGAGLGEHTIPFRIFNPRELVCVNIRLGSSRR
ncbi:MAG TPA: hypothetical protein DF613_08015 [Lachnospiraceae bacterium]|nr:hypothetical protein [Lachnospiraceae bacterium]